VSFDSNGCPQDLAMPSKVGADPKAAGEGKPNSMLKDMGVAHIHPNRICTNAMLAALSRAMPCQHELVSFPLNIS